MLKKQNFNETFTHVKGHQEKDKKYNELPLPVQPNISVDALAVEFHSEYIKSTMWVICLPINATQLNIDNMTVSRKYSNSARLRNKIIITESYATMEELVKWSKSTNQLGSILNCTKT
eukprot:11110850-Ditylum_brightwellii.AAC.1